jgi:RecB family exonuclease
MTKGNASLQQRFASTKSSISSSNLENENDDNEEVLHPEQFGPISMPKALSPSAVMEFKKCPQSYLLQYLYKLRQPQSPALAKGSMAHAALEQVFDLKEEDRTLENLQNLLRKEWGQERFNDNYKSLFDNAETGQRDIEMEREWGESALKLLENYYQVENPTLIKRPNPVKREIWLHSHLAKDASFGSTSPNTNIEVSKDDTFYVRGIVDRLDMIRPSQESREVALKIVDYKTGKAPNLKYSRPVNERIVEEAFYQLKVYALMLREKGAGDKIPQSNSMDLRFLQLFYLTSEDSQAKQWEYDLGDTQEKRDLILNEIHDDLATVWKSIKELVEKQDPKAFVGCDRSFCHCHKCRPRFEPGTLWEPN